MTPSVPIVGMDGKLDAALATAGVTLIGAGAAAVAAGKPEGLLALGAGLGCYIAHQLLEERA